MRSGLATGARLERLWQTRKRAVFVHPWKLPILLLVFPFIFAACMILDLVADCGKLIVRLGDFVSSAEEPSDCLQGAFCELCESRREKKLRFWARVKNGEAPKGWEKVPGTSFELRKVKETADE